MREILFRGQIMDSNEWVYGSLVYSPSENQYYIVEHSGDELSYPVKEETIGQFTGLLDKNGNKIFEDDIVRIDGKYCVVVFDNGCFYPIGAYIARSGFEYDKDDYKIIGNIYDNSELLNEV